MYFLLKDEGYSTFYLIFAPATLQLDDSECHLCGDSRSIGDQAQTDEVRPIAKDAM